MLSRKFFFQKKDLHIVINVCRNWWGKLHLLWPLAANQKLTRGIGSGGKRDLFGNESENLSFSLPPNGVLSTLWGTVSQRRKTNSALHAVRAWLMLAPRSAIRRQTCGWWGNWTSSHLQRGRSQGNPKTGPGIGMSGVSNNTKNVI